MNTNPLLNDVIFNSIDNGIIILDQDLKIHAWNHWLEISTGTSQSTIQGEILTEFYPYINKKKIRRKIKTVLVTNNSSYYASNKNGFLIDIPTHSITKSRFSSMQQQITIVPYNQEKNLVCMFIYDNTASCDANAQLNELNKNLKELSFKDPLTNLFNRRYFNEASAPAISLSLRNNTKLSVIMMDIDKFKNINDTYGHQCGDDVLVSLAKKLQKLIRKSDVPARFGGEEFVLLLPNTSEENAVILAENIRKKIEKFSLNYLEQTITFTISFGVTHFDSIQDKDNIENTISRADEALYEAKQTGRNKVVLAR